MSITMIMEDLKPEKLRNKAEKATLKSFVKGLQISRYGTEKEKSQQEGPHQLLQPFPDIPFAAPVFLKK